MPLRYGSWNFKGAKVNDPDDDDLDLLDDDDSDLPLEDEDFDDDLYVDEDDLDEDELDYDSQLEDDDDPSTDMVSVLNIVTFESEESVPAVVVYLDGNLENFSYRQSGPDSYDSSEYADGLADGLARAGWVCEINRFKYEVALIEDQNPPQSFVELDRELLTLQEQQL